MKSLGCEVYIHHLFGNLIGCFSSFAKRLFLIGNNLFYFRNNIKIDLIISILRIEIRPTRRPIVVFAGESADVSNF